jgi:hypothetical protein
MKVLYAMGSYYGYLHREQESVVVLERALGLARSQKDLRSEAHILSYLGWMRHNLGEFLLAKYHYEESLLIFQELDVQWGIAQAKVGLITIAYALKEYAEVKRLCEITIPLYEKIKAHAKALGDIKEIYALVMQMEEHHP